MELSPSTPTTALYNETGMWPVKEHIQYLTAMLYYGMVKKDYRVAKRCKRERWLKPIKDGDVDVIIFHLVQAIFPSHYHSWTGAITLTFM